MRLHPLFQRLQTRGAASVNLCNWAIPVNEDTPLRKTNFAFSPQDNKITGLLPFGSN